MSNTIKEAAGITRFFAERRLRKLGKEGWSLDQHEYLFPHISGSFTISKGDAEISYVHVMFKKRAVLKHGDKWVSFRGLDAVDHVEDIYETITGYRLASNPEWIDRYMDQLKWR